MWGYKTKCARGGGDDSLDILGERPEGMPPFFALDNLAFRI